MLIFLFWLLTICAIFSYFLYPLILLTLSKLQPTAHTNLPPSTDFPSASLIITAHNEGARIKSKILNSLACEYPENQLEIIIASDGSTDETDQIVSEFADQGVKLIRPEQRLGKENAQKHAITHAKGEILIFSDVATEIPANAIISLASHFSNPNIGAVSSEDRFISSTGEIAGEGAYVKYEMWLRKQESRLAGLVGLSGSFFAARKEICDDWDIHSPSDFNTALNCIKKGRKAITAPDVLGYYPDLKDPSKEYARKIRTVIRGITALTRHPEVLNPLKFGLFSFQVFSHKVMRWLEPWFLISLLTVNIAIADENIFYCLTLFGQIVFYSLAIAAHYNHKLMQNSAIKLTYFFVQVNVALLDASLKFISGQRMTTWKPSAR